MSVFNIVITVPKWCVCIQYCYYCTNIVCLYSILLLLYQCCVSVFNIVITVPMLCVCIQYRYYCTKVECLYSISLLLYQCCISVGIKDWNMKICLVLFSKLTISILRGNITGQGLGLGNQESEKINWSSGHWPMWIEKEREFLYSSFGIHGAVLRFRPVIAVRM